MLKPHSASRWVDLFFWAWARLWWSNPGGLAAQSRATATVGQAPNAIMTSNLHCSNRNSRRSGRWLQRSVRRFEVLHSVEPSTGS